MNNKYKIIIIDEEKGKELINRNVCAICGAIATDEKDKLCTSAIGLSECNSIAIMSVTETAKDTADEMHGNMIEDIFGAKERDSKNSKMMSRLMELVLEAGEKDE